MNTDELIAALREVGERLGYTVELLTEPDDRGWLDVAFTPIE